MYLLAKKTIYTIGCIGPLQYADFKAMTRRIGDLHAVLAHLEPTSNTNDSLKAMLYRFIEHLGFTERFSISQLLSFISNVAEQTPTHIAQEVLAGIPCVERQLHPRHFPRWDLWLKMLPDVVSDSNLQSLLIDSQTPVNQQIAALAQKMFENLINPLQHWSWQSNAIQYKNWNHECTNGCCQNAAQVYVNLVRLALLSVNDYRLKNMQTLCAIGLDEEMIELVQYQHKKQPFSTRDIASLLTSAPARALPALQAILLPSCSLVERMSIHALLTGNHLLHTTEQWVKSLAPLIFMAIPMCIIGFVSWTIVRTLAELTPLEAMSTEATNALQVRHGIARNSSRKLWEYVQQAIEVNLPALQKAITERNFTQLFRK